MINNYKYYDLWYQNCTVITILSKDIKVLRLIFSLTKLTFLLKPIKSATHFLKPANFSNNKLH